MNSKHRHHSKHHKKVKSIKVKESHEVFVLPPDLLKKLGISIGNVSSSSQSTADLLPPPSTPKVNHEKIPNFDNPAPNQEKSSADSSILETASLMKKSVFLSPTFVPIVANVASGELEIMNGSCIEESAHFTDTETFITGQVGSLKTKNKAIEHMNMTNDFDTNTILNTKKNCPAMIINTEADAPNMDNNNVCTANSNNIEIDYLDKSSISFLQDHCPNGELSLESKDIGVANLTSLQNEELRVPASEKSGSEFPPPKPLNKINIISEEIIPSSEFKEVKQNKCLKLSAFTPVTVDTVITTKKLTHDLPGMEECLLTDDNIITLTTEVNSEINVKDLSTENINTTESMEIEVYDTDQIGQIKDSESCNDDSNINNSNIILISTNQQILDPTEPSVSLDPVIMDNFSILENIKQEKVMLNAIKSTENEIHDTNNINQIDTENVCENSDSYSICTNTAVSVRIDQSIPTQAMQAINSTNVNNNIINSNTDIDVVKAKIAGDLEDQLIDEDDSKIDLIQLKDLAETEKKIGMMSDVSCNKPKMIENITIAKIQPKESIANKIDTVMYDPRNSHKIVDSDIEDKHKNNVTNVLDKKGTSKTCPQIEKTLNEKKKGRKKSQETPINESLANILNSSIEKSDCINADKVKELSTYLQQIYANKKRQNQKATIKNEKSATSNCTTNYSSKDNKVNKKNSRNALKHIANVGEKKNNSEDSSKNTPKNNNKISQMETNSDEDSKETANLNSSVIKSKLSIQGVEKPGGNLDLEGFIFDKSHVLKTYARKKYNKDNLTKQETNQFSIEKFIDSNEDINSKNDTESILEQEFCLCYDYGTLDYYECETSYEHIHFLQHNNINCNLEDIFSIYNEEETVGNIEISELKDEQSNEEPAYKICYHEYEDPNKHNAVNVDGDKKLTEIEIIDSNNDEDMDNLQCEIANLCKSGRKLSKNNDHSKESGLDLHDADAGFSKQDDKINKKVFLDKNVTSPENDTVKSRKRKWSITNSPQMQSQVTRKRFSSSSNEFQSSNKSDRPSCKKSIKCGVCNQLFASDDWKDHVANEHSFIAWKAGESFNFNDPNLPDKFREIAKMGKLLKCSICSTFETNQIMTFLTHVKNCSKPTGTERDRRRRSIVATYTCGVCKIEVENCNWVEHIGKEHNYLAWIDGEVVLNVNDEEVVNKHLKNIISANEGLTCYKCGLKRRRAKLYLEHIKKCNGEKNINASIISNDLNSSDVLDNSITDKSKITLEESVTDRDSALENSAAEKPKNELEENVSKQPKRIATSDKMIIEEVKSVTKKIHTDQPPRSLEDGTLNKQYKNNQKQLEQSFDSQLNGMLEDEDCEQTLSVLKMIKDKEEQQLTKTYDEEKGSAKICNSISKDKHSGNTTRTSNDDITKEAVSTAEKSPVKPTTSVLENNVTDQLTPTINTIKRKRGRPRKQAPLEESINLETADQSNRSILDSSVSGQSANVLENRVIEDPFNKCYTNKRRSTVRTSFNNDSKQYEDEKCITCGVCKARIPIVKWTEHAWKEHNYLAWEEGSAPLNLDDEEAVHNHLIRILRAGSSLICFKCGVTRKRTKLYLAHMETCNGDGTWMNNSSVIDLNTSLDRSERRRKHIETMVTCAVCQEEVQLSLWYKHIGEKHRYLAWQEGSTPLNVNDEAEVREHLLGVVKRNEYLECYKCGFQRKRPNLYLQHMESCNEEEETEQTNDDKKDISVDLSDDTKVIKCGVCSQEMVVGQWVEHIGKEHKYMAWQEGSTPVNLEDLVEVRDHLKSLSYQFGGLVCHKCGINKKYPKSYLTHVAECYGEPLKVNLDESLNDSVVRDLNAPMFKFETESVTCAVCKKEIQSDCWVEHIEGQHGYLAWVEGQEPIDTENEEVVHNYLYLVSKAIGGLRCPNCGLIRKYLKAYLLHKDTCKTGLHMAKLSEEAKNKAIYECGVCGEKVAPSMWINHAMNQHYNVAWLKGETPIDINAPYTVEPYIKEYWQKFNKLVCKTCGIKRVSAVGFYAHIIQCGKTEEQMEVYKAVCDICNNKYLKIYKSQHMTVHRESELLQERKLKAAQEKEMIKEGKVKEEEAIISGGKRKAAEKAKSVIEKYQNNLKKGAHYCSKCSFSSDIESEYLHHECVERCSDNSDSDISVDLEQSDAESSESEFDSNVSGEEEEARLHEIGKNKKGDASVYKGSAASRIQRLPYEIKHVSGYLKKSTEEFAATFYTDEDLFPQWRNINYEVLNENEVAKYTPPLEESCSTRFNNNSEWSTLRRFETRRIPENIDVSFVGASIHCIRWLPCHVNNDLSSSENQYLAVVCHLGNDAPRYSWYETPLAPGLIQIWDLHHTVSNGELVMAIAHDFGAVWAVDWCPSGSRDILDPESEDNKNLRLGLLSIACSNGSAYILPIPYPESVDSKEKTIPYCKIKPVVEMRLVPKTSKRSICQASAIKWSSEKGHSKIVVGYSDGTTAYYDLKGDSPLLSSVEDDVMILYPYHDDHPLNACIEDVDEFPSVQGVGVMAAGSVGGAVSYGGAGTCRANLLHSRTASPRILFPPHWPAALLAGDDCIVNLSVNELEWWGNGRRVGGVGAAAGCPWCGKFVAAALPLIRSMRTHPVFSDLYKQAIATLHMMPLNNKRKKKQNDELSMVVEPITYDEAIKKYGIEFKITDKSRITKQKCNAMAKETCPERFPLTEVAAMTFCPAPHKHHKLAIALHSGIIIFVCV